MLNRSQSPSPIISAPETPGRPSEHGVKGRKDTEMEFKETPALCVPSEVWAGSEPLQYLIDSLRLHQLLPWFLWSWCPGELLLIQRGGYVGVGWHGGVWRVYCK